MGDFRAKLRAKLSRRNSAARRDLARGSPDVPSAASSTTSCSRHQRDPSPAIENAGPADSSEVPSRNISSGPAPVSAGSRVDDEAGAEETAKPLSAHSHSKSLGLDDSESNTGAAEARRSSVLDSATPDHPATTSDMSGNDLRSSTTPALFSISERSVASFPPNTQTHADATLPAVGPTSDHDRPCPAQLANQDSSIQTPRTVPDNLDSYFSSQYQQTPSVSRPTGPPRRQSLLPDRQTTLIRALLESDQADDLDPSNAERLLQISTAMATRKIWAKRPGASATLITIHEDDLVDDVRDLILRKYGNSLGRQFDAPDLTLRIVPRDHHKQERTLGPDEPMGRTLDTYFPGGQSVDEALIIDTPLRRTPRASPRAGQPPHANHYLNPVYLDELRPSEGTTDYFGPGAVAQLPVTLTAPGAAAHPHSISVLSTGQIPQIPSPGTTRSRPYRTERPPPVRQHTPSPTVLGLGETHAPTISVAPGHGTHPAYIHATGPRTHSSVSSDQPAAIVGGLPPSSSPLPTPPPPPLDGGPPPVIQRVGTPPPRTSSPRPGQNARLKKKKVFEPSPPPPGILNSGVPPINVLIVEDNIINLKLIEAFVKRLKVRWQTAMNGRDAVSKWRSGGFHLVLMDIQLPVMSGLDATREIRRLERINSIGVFSSSANSPPEETTGEPSEEDKLENRDMFLSPVIIVALTASSLQSDRHQALAAGCNDFLTKPVNFVWLERKVMEWGCMQALIDFDGWRKWKDFSKQAEELEAAAKKGPIKSRTKKNRHSLTFPS